MSLKCIGARRFTGNERWKINALSANLQGSEVLASFFVDISIFYQPQTRCKAPLALCVTSETPRLILLCHQPLNKGLLFYSKCFQMRVTQAVPDEDVLQLQALSAATSLGEAQGYHTARGSLLCVHHRLVSNSQTGTHSMETDLPRPPLQPQVYQIRRSSVLEAPHERRDVSTAAINPFTQLSSALPSLPMGALGAAKQTQISRLEPAERT